MANTKVQSEQIEDGSITADKIADGAIVATELADNAVTTAKINADAVTGAKIADDAIDSEHYTDGSIDTAHIADAQITVAKMAANSVDSDQYVDGSIDTVHLADLQVTTAKIANGNISTAKIADNAVTSAKIDTNIDIAGTFDVTGATTLDAGLTVDTTTLVVDATNNRVGIGTPSPLDALHITSAVSTDYRGNLLLSDSTAIAAGVGGQINFGGKYTGSTYTEWAGIQGTKENATDGQYGGQLEFKTRAHNGALSTKMTLDSSGNVGIGEPNPDASIHITSNTPTIHFNESDASQEWKLGSFGGAFALYDSTDSTYRLVVDGSGDVGIGTTSPAARLEVDASAVGEIVRIAKSGNRVGSIGASNNASSDLTIFSSTASHVGLQFGNTRLQPTDNAGATTDGVCDFGVSTSRFKDLYLSGGVVFDAVAGNATSNTLDDYEEGTWNPDWTTTGTDFDQSGTSNSNGYYTKIGNTVMVTFSCVISGTVSGGTGNVIITGLPFTAERASYGAFAPGRITLTYDSYYVSIPENSSNLNVVGIRSGNTGVQLLASEVNGNGTPFFSSTIVYRTTA